MDVSPDDGARARDRRRSRYETDRMRFIGRGRTVAAPQRDGRARHALGHCRAPCSIRSSRSATESPLEPEQSATIDMVSGVGETRDAALRLVDKYQDRRLADRVFELAWTHSQVVLRQLNATEADAQLYGRLASSVIYANASLRADRERSGQEPPRPVRPVGLRDLRRPADRAAADRATPANIDLVRQLVQAHAYWRLKGLAVDLVIWNEDHDGYRQLLQEQIMGLIAAGVEARCRSIGPAASSCGARSRCRTRTASCSSRSRARSSPTAAERWPTRSTAAARRERASPRLTPTQRLSIARSSGSRRAAATTI